MTDYLLGNKKVACQIGSIILFHSTFLFFLFKIKIFVGYFNRCYVQLQYPYWEKKKKKNPFQEQTQKQCLSLTFTLVNLLKILTYHSGECS